MGIFAAGAMLFWGLVAAVPIVLHLLRRRRRRTLPWGAMRFLQAAVCKRAKRFQLWQWLLLLLRVAVTTLIAVGLARPFLSSAENRPLSSEQPEGVLCVVVIDASYSMQAIRDGQSSFQRAVDAAASFVDQANRADGFLLIRAGARVEAVIQQVTYQANAVAIELERLQPGFGIMNLSDCRQVVEELIQQARDDGWDSPVQVAIFSDQQRLSWEVQGAAAASAVQYWSVDCGTESAAANLAVTELAIAADTENSDEDAVRVQASLLETTASTGLLEGQLQLVVDGRVDQSQVIPRLSSGIPSSVVWTTRLAPGFHAIEVRAQSLDAIAVDNRRTVVYEQESPASVALFGPDEADRRFVELALRAAGHKGAELASLPFDRLARTPLGRYRVWVLCNPRRLTADQQRRLQEHVAQGGGLVWWLGAELPVATEFNVSDEGLTQGVDDTGNRWKAIEQRTASDPLIDPLQYASPLLSPFEAYPAAGLLTLPVFRWWEVEFGNSWQPVLMIAAEAESATAGSPLIASLERDGQGRQVVVTTPAGPGRRLSNDIASTWNAIVAWPTFLPLVEEMIRWAARPEKGPSSFVVGQPLRGVQADGSVGEQLQGPAETRLPVTVESKRGSRLFWSAPASFLPGLYLWQGGDEAGQAAVAVNVDPREGNLERTDRLPEGYQRVPANDIQRMLNTDAAPGTGVANAGKEDAASASSTASHADDSQEVAWWFLLVAAGLLLVESSLVRFLEERF